MSLHNVGDGPAVAAAMGFKRPGNAKSPCRMCEIKGIRYKNTYYVPHNGLEDLPLRHSVRKTIRDVVLSRSKEVERDWGITRASILLKLRSVNFPRSFPIDIMHCVLQNITPTIFKLWNGTKLLDCNNSDTSLPSYQLSKNALEMIGQQLAGARGSIPSYLGHAPRRIDLYYRGFKAAEWKAWLTMYALPLITDKLDERYVQNFRDLSQLYVLATRHQLNHDQVAEVGSLAQNFVNLFEKNYYRGEEDRLPVCSVNNHYLLHLSQHIKDCGPACYWWQFPMERFCGIIKPLARSKSQLSVSLSNAILMTEHLNHLHYCQSKLPLVSGYRNETNTNFPQLLDPLSSRGRQLMHAQHRYWLPRLSYIIQKVLLDTEVHYYYRCQCRPDLIVGSAKQTRSEINRANNFIVYLNRDSGLMELGEVEVFAHIEGAEDWALVRRVASGNSLFIDRAKRLASYTRESTNLKCTWIQTSEIKSVFGEIATSATGPHQRARRFCVTDIDLFCE